MTYRTLTQRARNVRLVILDVDGVLTDGSIWTGENGELKMLQAAGIPVAILTGRVSAQTAARCRELGITSVAQGKRFKTDAFRALLSKHNVSAEETAYMGDDVPDIPVLRAAGLSAIPADASAEVRPLAHFVSDFTGGNGAVRSLAELILKAQGKWDALIFDHYVREKGQ